MQKEGHLFVNILKYNINRCTVFHLKVCASLCSKTFTIIFVGYLLRKRGDNIVFTQSLYNFLKNI